MQDDATPRRSQRVGAVVVVAVAASIGLAWAVLAVGHLGDRYLVDQASGASAALAEQSSRGVLYPELFDGGTYGGTRYMPVGPVLHGALAGVTGNLIAGGKLLSSAASAAVAALVVVALRRLGTSLPVALGLTAVLVATRPFVFTSFNLRSDSLAVAFQLGALLSIWPDGRRRSTPLGGFLAVLAILTKFTSAWALVAGGAWLWSRRRDDFGRFALGAGVAAVVVGGGALAWSQGRLVENLVELGGPEVLTASAPGDAVHNLVDTVRAAGPPTLLLLVLGGAAWLAGVLRKGDFRASPLALAAAVAAGITVVVFTDWGAYYNHLLDLLVLSTLAVGAFIADRTTRPVAGAAADRSRTAAPIAIAGIALLTSTTVLLPDAIDVGEERPEQAVDPLAGHIDPEAPILVEDPFLVLASGHDPVVLDPFMYRYLAEAHPEQDAALVARIERGAFAAIVLTRPLSDTAWYEHFFSPAVLAAIDRFYEVDERIGELDVLRPA